MSDLYFNEESDYSEKNTCVNKVFRSTILQPFQFAPEQKKMCGNESHQNKTNHIHSSAADLLHIRIGKLDWRKCWDCKNEVRDKDCLCCREMDAMVTVLAKILECEGIILPSKFYGQLPDY